MWIWVAGIGLVWVWLRKRMGKPILPDFLHADPFKQGAVLVKTETGQVAAVPADTVAIHPAVAATQGLLSANATAAVAAALSPATMSLAQAVLKAAPAGGSLLDPTTGQATMGAWQMFGTPHTGPDYRLDEFGLPRSNSLASRPWRAR